MQKSLAGFISFSPTSASFFLIPFVRISQALKPSANHVLLPSASCLSPCVNGETSAKRCSKAEAESTQGDHSRSACLWSGFGLFGTEFIGFAVVAGQFEGQEQ